MGRARPSPTKPRPPRATRATRSRPSRMTLEDFGTSVGGGMVVKEIRGAGLAVINNTFNQPLKPK